MRKGIQDYGLRVMAAERYAAADKSDPFAFARAITYLNRNPKRFNSEGQSCDYDAEETSETRTLPDGTRYQAVVYKNMVRP